MISDDIVPILDNKLIQQIGLILSHILYGSYYLIRFVLIHMSCITPDKFIISNDSYYPDKLYYII